MITIRWEKNVITIVEQDGYLMIYVIMIVIVFCLLFQKRKEIKLRSQII